MRRTRNRRNSVRIHKSMKGGKQSNIKILIKKILGITNETPDSYDPKKDPNYGVSGYYNKSSCPMCRSHLTPIRNGPILNKTNKMSSNKKHTEYIINEISYTFMIYDEESRGHKFKSLKRHTNYKMIHRRYNK